MKAYLLTSGAIFTIITGIHAWRLVAEGARHAIAPESIPLTLLAAGLSAWAWLLLARTSKR